jgi:hypothetical protein
LLATLSLESPSTAPAADGGAASGGEAAGAGASAKVSKKEMGKAVLIEAPAMNANDKRILQDAVTTLQRNDPALRELAIS